MYTAEMEATTAVDCKPRVFDLPLKARDVERFYERLCQDKLPRRAFIERFGTYVIANFDIATPEAIDRMEILAERLLGK